MYIQVGLALAIVLIMSWLTGNLVSMLTKNTLINQNKTPYGFSFMLGVFFLVYYPIEFYHLSFHYAEQIFIAYFAFTLIFNVVFFRIIKIKFNYGIVFDFLLIVLSIGSVLYVLKSTAMGGHGFDTSYYLGWVNQNIGNSFVNAFDGETGGFSHSGLPAQYNLQSYYLFGSVVTSMTQKILSILKVSYMDSYVTYYWTFVLLFSILSSLVVLNVLRINKVKKYIYVGTFVFVIFIFNYYYFTNVFAFYGNSYRGLLTSILLLYLLIVTDGKKSFNPYIVSALLASVISTSSSGLGIYVVYVFSIFYYLIRSDIKNVFSKMLVIVLPLIIFALNYLTNLSSIKVIVIVLFIYLFSLLIDKFGTKLQLDLKKWLFNNLKYIYLIVFILFISLGFFVGVVQKEYTYLDFFYPHSTYDMVRDYFHFFELRNFVINLTLYAGIFIYVLKKRDILQITILVALILFLNPLVIPSTYRILTSFVFFRLFDSIINVTSVSLFLVLILKKIKYKRISYVFISLIIAFSLYNFQDNFYYHESFRAEGNYNWHARMDQDLYEFLEHSKNYVTDGSSLLTQMPETRWVFPNSRHVFTRRKLSVREDTPKYNMYQLFYVDQYVGDINRPAIEDIDTDIICSGFIDFNIEYVMTLDSAFFWSEDDEFIHVNKIVYDCPTTELLYHTDKYALFKIKTP
jgi:hypothetical protein